MSNDFETIQQISNTDAATLANQLEGREILPGSFAIEERRTGIHIVRSERSDLPFIAVSGEHGEDGTVTIFRDGTRAYVHKDQVYFE